MRPGNVKTTMTVEIMRFAITNIAKTLVNIQPTLVLIMPSVKESLTDLYVNVLLVGSEIRIRNAINVKSY